MTGEKATRLVKNQRVLCGNDNMRTHNQVVLQSGAEIPATAKPETKNKDITSGAKRDIISGVW